MMRLGLSSYTFSWAIGIPGKSPENRLDAFGLLEKTIQHKVRCLQIADNLPLDSLSVEDRKRLREEAQQAGVFIEVGTRGLQPDHLVKYLDIADFFRSPILRVVIDLPDFQPGLDEIEYILTRFIPRLKEKNIRLAIENHDRFKASEFEHIIQHSDPRWVGICLDSVNSMGAGEGIDEVFRILSPYVLNFHIKDFTVRRIWHMMGFEIVGVPAGNGKLPIRDLILRLEKIGNCQSGILELWTPQQNSIGETVHLESEWAAESINYLKTILNNYR